MNQLLLISFILIFLLTPDNIVSQRNPGGLRTDDRNPGGERTKEDNQRERPTEIKRTPKPPDPPKVDQVRKDPTPDYIQPELQVPIIIEEINTYIYEETNIVVNIVAPVIERPPLTLKELGLLRYKEMKYFAAYTIFIQAIDEDYYDEKIDDYDLFYLRGIVELELKLFEEAKEDFDLYVNYIFYKPEGYFQRGLALFYMNNKQKALEDFQIAADYGDKKAAMIIKRFYN